jgi:threonine synthase
MQKKQMTTQTGDNVHVFGIEGNFDDAQRGVKEIFHNQELNNELLEHSYAFSSANSINWGRLVPQIVYYFKAYAMAVGAGRIAPRTPINFAVPTGNFGDILAGYYAKIMGLPIKNLICASNSNNVLTDFISTGTYDRRRDFHKTMSPSMDILISSNLERLLFHVTDGDHEQIAAWMKSLQDEGSYTVPKPIMEKIRETFFGAWVDEVETAETINRYFNDYGYLLDPHSAVGVRAMEKYRLLTSDDTYTICLSTASPYKFGASVLGALGHQVPENAPLFDVVDKLQEISKLPIPKGLAALKDLPEIHKEIIHKEDMAKTILKALDI